MRLTPTLSSRTFRGQRRVLSATGAGVLALAGAAAAADTAPADKTAGPQLEEIVVTATRHEESLSKVAISVTAMTQESLDLRGIKDIQDIARFTPGISVDNSGTANISIRGIASSGGAGTTGIYIDDTPIQMRAIAFNPDESLPKSFDIERVEVLRGPQGTLFGAGSEGGTVRYITTPPSLTRNSVYGRGEVSFTPGGEPSYEAGVAAGGPLVDGVLGARISVWTRRDGGWIDRVDATDPSVTLDKHSNHTETSLVRLAAIWAPSDKWTVTPSIYFQDRKTNDVSNYWPLYSDPSSHHFVSANPTGRPTPDTFYLPALKIEGDFGAIKFISNTSYYHRKDTTGYDGTMYNLGFYQSLFAYNGFNSNFGGDPASNFPMFLDNTGVHLGPSANSPGDLAYRAPASIDNGQQNFVQEFRLQSTDPNAKFVWTAGVFYSSNRQSYLEQLHDSGLGALLQAYYPAAGISAPEDGNYVFDAFGANNGSNPFSCIQPADSGIPSNAPHCGQVVTGIDPNSSYFLHTNAKDEQFAVYGEGSYAITDTLKAVFGGRYAKVKYSFDTVTGGAQLFGTDVWLSGSHSENVFTPKLGLNYQHDPNNLYYFTFSKGFRPGGSNNPVPQAACAGDFESFGITNSPATYDSDTVQSYEVGAKNNFNNRIRIASSVYYIKWHNIQQTVLPPICQISWIQNLGEAVAKGADIQAEFAVTDSFSAEVSAGYTNARYTADSFVGTDHTVLPVAAQGNAIAGQGGQPGSPATVSVGLEYKFQVFDHESFVRADYQYQGKGKWNSPSQDSGTLQYDDANYMLPATNFVTARFGMNFGDWQVAAFVDNLFDARTVTNYNYSINPGTAPEGVNSATTRLERQWTFRPRTIGLTFTYRH
jgi:outer membrane receptor protein involved in Fe transport